jgi:hypothetical protein
MESFLAYLSYSVAKGLKEDILSRIPNKKEFEIYKRAISIAKVSSGNVPVYAIYLNNRVRGVKKVDTDKTIVLVKCKAKYPNGPELKIKALEKYGPWTLDTIPYLPKPTEAKITYKKSTSSEVKRVAKARNKDRKTWEKELAKYGVRVSKKSAVKIKMGKDTPDVAFLALNLEFGLNGQKAMSHWRASQRQILPNLKKLFATDHSITKTFSDPTYGAWEQWPPKTKDILSSGDAKKFAGFQDKVKISTG